ncbi:glycosyltransferase involved in cell wall biosynthesis [Halanaerobium congolense]|uniref:Glycosyltransferase involved in cell wall biosynthesis n=1 Tax=Halanaerobium congolense TaxID=54121 RepID=A0A318DZZ1_9FIRM|nr:glycosyltransferase family 4 protein [Halanaerobium congolense]PXV62294.1 glycosyltransferase involved in cell wall biosynthesis [Halanaerobium congolense]
MNICFFLGGFSGVGGIGRVTSILANELSKDSNINVFTLSFYESSSNEVYELNKNIKKNYLYDQPITMKKAFLLLGFIKLRKYLLDNSIDIIIACGALYYPITIVSTLNLNIKTICWEHSHVNNTKDHLFQGFSRMIGAKCSDKILTLTKNDKKEYISKYNIDNVNKIYNPIDPSLFKYTKSYNEKSKKIISVGRLSYQKNFKLLVEIAKEVLKNNSDWKWDIYGDGELREEIQEKIISYNLQNKITLKGHIDNIYEIYSDYSILIMTSRYEGFPMTLLEGLANGLPLISFDVLTGPNEIIKHNKNGFLVKPFDKNKMVEYINLLIEDEKKRIAFSKNARKSANNFKLSKIVHEWEQLLYNLLETD